LEYYNEEDDYIKQVIYKITMDEAHHAAFAWKIFKWAVKNYGDLSEKFFQEFDNIIEKEKSEDVKEDCLLLSELKNILRKGTQPSDKLKSYLEPQDEKYYLYSRVINQIYDVIKS